MYSHIYKNTLHILSEIPPEVTIVAAVKNRTSEEIAAVIDAGVSVIGHNYIQEACFARDKLGDIGEWHFIGHLQSKKAKKAIEGFDLIETVDSIRLGSALNLQAELQGRFMPVLIEVNIGRECQKNGVWPEDLFHLAESLQKMPMLKLQGLMTMGPLSKSSDTRPYFAEAKKLFDNLKQHVHHQSDIRYLSMGMSDTYITAIEEGANVIRLGTAIFGSRG